MRPVQKNQELQQKEVRVKYNDITALKTIEHGILNLLPVGPHRQIVVICIGTDRSTGDSLGPLIGNFLHDCRLEKFHLYGTLDDPVHAVNLNEKLAFIYKKYFHPYIIAIDACLGKSENIGIIKVATGPVKPGAGVNKVLPEVGNMHLTGVVNISGYMEYFVLQNTRLSLVMKMAKQMAAAIKQADQFYANNQKAFLQLEWDMNHDIKISK